MVLGVEVGLSPSDFVLDGDPTSPLPKKGRSPPPQFSTHFYWAVGKMRNCGLWNVEGKMRNGMCGKLLQNGG